MPGTTDTLASIDFQLGDALPGDAVGREEEVVAARDADDQLVRQEAATRERFREMVTLTIDGYPVVIPKSIPKTDAQGNELRDAAGELVPRNTTIYDAAVRLATGYRTLAGEYVPPVWTWDELRERIPVLCHLPHLNPVGVCRMCSVSVSKRTAKGDQVELKGNRKLAPACQHETLDGIAVNTRSGLTGLDPSASGRIPLPEYRQHEDAARKAGALIGKAVGLLAELLVADHLPEAAGGEGEGGGGKRYENELAAVAVRLGVTAARERLRKPAGAFSRNRMADASRTATDPRRPHAKPVRRFPLDLLDPTEVQPEDRRLGAGPLAAWEAWNARVDEQFPYSSRTVVVDHDRCILCDRCVRSCAEVRPFHVIGHTGKGYATRVSFGLDALMGERTRADGAADPALRFSGCVQCGECMTACPTGALSLRRRVQPRAWEDSPALIPQNPNTPFPAGSGFLTADEMRAVWLYYVSPTRGPRVVFPFRSVPYSYLKWNEGAVRKIEGPPGERRELCREGEYGSTAFLLQGTGRFWVYEKDGGPPAQQSWFARLTGRASAGPKPPPDPHGHPEYGWRKRVAEGAELVLGEMACLTNRRRTASVVAVADPAPRITLETDVNGWPVAAIDPSVSGPVVVYEITRNMLDMIQRSADARADVEEMYTARAVQTSLWKSNLFAGLTADQERARVDDLLRAGDLEYRRVRAGETVVAEGDRAADFYVVRTGTVEVSRTVAGKKRVLALRAAGEHFGEVGLMADRPGARGATVTALDPTELVRIPGPAFRAFLDRFPDVRERMTGGGVRTPVAGLTAAPPAGVLDEYVEQGLYQAQRMLALDLLSCTRCDECTKACADSHDGHARLLREGLRFGDFLVAASCRSCHKPYCMEGCPVDAIHRKGDRLEVLIEDHCIGCGLCERNCPYGAIHMVERGAPNYAALANPGREAGGNPNLIAGVRQAVNCDLCGPVGGQPFCVSACPHDAAVRLTGLDLLNRVTARAAQEG